MRPGEQIVGASDVWADVQRNKTKQGEGNGRASPGSLMNGRNRFESKGTYTVERVHTEDTAHTFDYGARRELFGSV